MSTATAPDFILHNAAIHTMDDALPRAQAFAATAGIITAVGTDADILKLRGPATRVIDAKGHTVIPGLNDSHLHIIRGGLNYNMELRWDGVPTLADAMFMLREQARITPPPQWVRVVGGFNELQFAEKRLPTLDEINAAAPDTPVFILHLYDRALLNQAALRAVGYTKDTPEPPGGTIVRDAKGNPTGMLIAKPNAMILYKTLSLGPKLHPDDQYNSTRHFMRELNRLGLTSAADAGGGFQNYPDDYAIINKLHDNGHMTVRIAYNLFTQRPKQELDDFRAWSKLIKPGQGSAMFKHNGAGEMLVFSAADFEDFLEPRPDLAASMDDELYNVVRFLSEQRWPFRLHATYDETISRALSVFERVNREVPLAGLHWFFDHAETISDRNIDRVKALGGGIAVQHRMAFQGEYFINRYGAQAARATPPVKRMLAAGIPVGAGTDATRVASYNPWTSLAWLITGQTVGGTTLYGDDNLLSRTQALRAWTRGSAWFSSDEETKGAIKVGMLADAALLSEDFFTIREDRIRGIESLLTIVGGNIVFAQGSFAPLDPPLPPISPDWSPVRRFGGHYRTLQNQPTTGPLHMQHTCCPAHAAASPSSRLHDWLHAQHDETRRIGLACTCWI